MMSPQLDELRVEVAEEGDLAGHARRELMNGVQAHEAQDPAFEERLQDAIGARPEVFAKIGKDAQPPERPPGVLVDDAARMFGSKQEDAVRRLGADRSE